MNKMKYIWIIFFIITLPVSVHSFEDPGEYQAKRSKPSTTTSDVLTTLSTFVASVGRSASEEFSFLTPTATTVAPSSENIRSEDLTSKTSAAGAAATSQEVTLHAPLQLLPARLS